MHFNANESVTHTTQLEQKLAEISQELKSCRSTLHLHITEEKFMQNKNMNSCSSPIRVIHDIQKYMQAKVDLLIKENEYRKYQNELKCLQDQIHTSLSLKNIN